MAEKKKKGPKLENKVTLNPETGEIEADKPLNVYTHNDDALNPGLNMRGQDIGTHETDVNKQTDLELGAIADPGGIDPASDREFLEGMKENITDKQAKQ